MKNALLFGLLALFWGGSFVAIKFVVAGMAPVTGAALRVVIALASLSVILKALGKDAAVPWGSRWRLWLTGLFSQGIPFALLFWGERLIPAGLAGLINGTSPVWTFLMGAALGREPHARSPRALAGLALGVLGTALIFAPSIRMGGGSGEAAGALACLGMALCYAVGGLLARTVLVGARAVDVYVGALHQQVASTAFLVLLAAAREGPLRTVPPPAALGAIFYLGFFSTAVAFLIYFRLIRDWGALKASTVTYVMPVVTLLFDRLFFGHWPRPAEAGGAAVVLGGVLLLHSAKKP